MSSKSFVKTLVAVVVLFFIANVALYFGFVNTSLGSDKTHGDLSNLASQCWPDSATPQKQYAVSHLEFSDYIARRTAGEDIAIDVLTIGDSFSNGGQNHGGGAAYQDYMAERYGLTVLNIKTIRGLEALDMVRLLADSGYLVELKPRVIIVESVERAVAVRYDRSEMPKLSTLEAEQLTKALIAGKEEERTTLLPGFMVKRNIDYIKSRYRKLNGDDSESVVSWAKLSRPLFSTDTLSDELMYYTDDIRFTTGDVARIEQNIATVADMCRAQGIEFVFLPCPDKFTVYRPYVVDDGPDYPEKLLLDELLAQPRDYYMVDAKRVLRGEAARGVQDIYWADDTHWSWVGLEPVVDEMMQHILK